MTSATVPEVPVTGHLRIRQRQAGPVYYAAWRDARGKQHQRKLGPAWTKRGRPADGYLSETAAQHLLEEILADARRGTLEMRRRSGATFADAAAEFIRYVTERKRERSTIADYQSVIDGYLLDEFGGLLIEDVTPDMVDEYKDRLLTERRLSNRTIVRHLTVLHGIFRRAKRVWGLQTNPAAAELVDRPSMNYSGEFQTLTPAEVLALSAAAKDPQDGAIYLTAAFTGLRLGELLALRWMDVAFNLQRLQVRRNRPANSRGEGEKAPKSGKVRSAPMVDEVMAALDVLSQRQGWTGPEDLVFVDGAGETVNQWTLRRHFYADLKRAGLGYLRESERPIVFHDLRHAFGTLGAQVWELPKLQAYMGHGHVTTTMRYVHHAPAARDVGLLQDVIRNSGLLEGDDHGRELQPRDDGRGEPAEQRVVRGHDRESRGRLRDGGGDVRDDLGPRGGSHRRAESGRGVGTAELQGGPADRPRSEPQRGVDPTVSMTPRYPQEAPDRLQNEESPAVAGLSEEAPTGIEPVYTALQAAGEGAERGSKAKETTDG